MTMQESKNAFEDALFYQKPLPYDAMTNGYVAIQNYLARNKDCTSIELIDGVYIKVDAQCNSCGTMMSSQDHYCPNCGKKIIK